MLLELINVFVNQEIYFFNAELILETLASLQAASIRTSPDIKVTTSNEFKIRIIIETTKIEKITGGSNQMLEIVCDLKVCVHV